MLIQDNRYSIKKSTQTYLAYIQAEIMKVQKGIEKCTSKDVKFFQKFPSYEFGFFPSGYSNTLLADKTFYVFWVLRSFTNYLFPIFKKHWTFKNVKNWFKLSCARSFILFLCTFLAEFYSMCAFLLHQL